MNWTVLFAPRFFKDKARFGDYRVGLTIDKKRRVIDVSRVLHRREIYRYFP